jgi:N2,N2-dimethylguanosine tRNA methyltransferase
VSNDPQGRSRHNIMIKCIASSALMYSHSPERNRVDVVDLDPYGTAAPFIDAAVQCLIDGGCLSAERSPSFYTSDSPNLDKCRSPGRDMHRPFRFGHQ